MNRAKKKVYPDWIQKHIKDGMTVKVIGGKYYLYRRKTSRRIEGRKNPQPEYEYLGIITEDGLIPPRKRCLDISGIIIREFGFSYALEKACPDSWKSIQGKQWQEKLMAIIISKSRNSYILDTCEHVKTANELHMQLGTMVSSLGRKLSETYHITLEEVQSLDTVYLVNMNGKYVISRIDNSQQSILDRLGVCMEVPKGLH